MRTLLTIALLMLPCLIAWTQPSVQPKQINYGLITQETDRVVDIVIKSTSAQKDFLLRATFSHEFDVRYTTKTLEAGGEMIIRIKLNPRQKGKFHENVELWFSSQTKPIILPIDAEVLYVNINENNPCPDFSERAAECCTQNLFRVTVIDKTSKKPIAKSTVKLEEQGFLHFSVLTNEEGRVSQEVPIGFYEIIAEKKGYNKGSIQSYINKRNNNFVIELERNKDWKETPEVKPEPKDSIVIIPPALDSITAEVPTDPNLLDASLRPNNVVFLLDVSSSMAQGDKLELLKTALSELSKVLRPQDQVTLISYAGEAKILLPTTSGDQKASINQIIADLHANGVTSGAKGFTKAYNAIKEHYIVGGNNQLIVITDGAFKPEDQTKIEKLVKKWTKKQIRTSLVAIKSNTFAKEKLTLVSNLGNGSFLLIEDELQAKQILIEELKKQSNQ